MDLIRKMRFLVCYCLLCVFIVLKIQIAKTNKGSWFSNYSSTFAEAPLSSPPLFTTSKMGRKIQEIHLSWSLRFDYYDESCPQAEQIIKSTVQQLYQLRPNLAPEFLRPVFHDCFIEGCDAPVILDTYDGIKSEKDTPQNEFLKGFDQIDIIKSELEEICPEVVSCADIVVLAARESVLLAGVPFYLLQDDIVKITDVFGSRGFDGRKPFSLLGAHRTGMVHSKFILDQLHNFSGANRPDPSIDTEFLDLLRSKRKSSCASFTLSPSPLPSRSPSPSPSPSPSSSIRDLLSALLQAMKKHYEGSRSDFGTLRYHRHLQRRGILYADQSLTAGEETDTWVRAYASDTSLFGKDFAMAILNLSNH